MTPENDPTGVLKCIDHVAVAVRDVGAAMSYYTSDLGLSLLHDEQLPDVAVRLAYLGTDSTAGEHTMLQLVQPLGPGPISEFIAARGEALHHVCFAVQDISHALTAIPGEQDATVFLGGRHRRCAFLTRQPNGLLVELTEQNERYSPVSALNRR